ncbi:MAG: 6-bladed beta-propeller [Phycisphaerales bacterium]|nr:MAG: 6-bladed beta-propeller [Phycisphaerales bacterium]
MNGFGLQYTDMTSRGRKRRPFPCRAFVGATLVALILPAGACSQKLKPIFEPWPDPIVWPVGQRAPRIRYVGQLSSSADLKPPRKAFQAITDLIAGARKPQKIQGPGSVMRTRDGDALWIADPGGRCLHRLDLADRSYLRIDRVGGSPLLSPVDVSPGPDGSIYVCDSEGVAVYRLSENDGVLIESLRLPGEVGRPAALSYTHGAREIILVDVSAHNIKVLGLDGSLRRIIGRRGTGPGEFNFPCAVADDGDLIWIVDAGNQRVQGLTRAGEPVVSIGQPGDAPGDLALPKDVAIDSDGHIYVVDRRYENIQIFNRSGTLLLFFGEEGTGPGEFWLPAGIFIDSDDRIWVCDSYNGRVQVFDYLKTLEADQYR